MYLQLKRLEFLDIASAILIMPCVDENIFEIAVWLKKPEEYMSNSVAIIGFADGLSLLEADAPDYFGNAIEYILFVLMPC